MERLLNATELKCMNGPEELICAQYKHKPQNNMKYKMFFFFFSTPLSMYQCFDFPFPFFPFVHLAWSVDSQEWGSHIALSDQTREGRQKGGGGDGLGREGGREQGRGREIGRESYCVFVLCRLGKLQWQSIAGPARPVSQDEANERFISGCSIY